MELIRKIARHWLHYSGFFGLPMMQPYHAEPHTDPHTEPHPS
jgi:hypothetical protein